MARLKSALELATRGNGNGKSHNGETNAAAAPFRIVDRRSGSAYGFNNTLVEAAVQTPDRQTQNLVDYDFHRTISVIGRRTLLSLGRVMFWKIPALHACVLEQAAIAAVPFNPIYAGRNKSWGDLAKDWLNQYHGVMDLAGWPYDYETYCQNIVISNVVDGELFTLLTEDASQNARIQTIPTHRVGSRYQTGGMAVVKYQGSQLFIDDKLVDDNLPFTFSTPLEFEASVIDGAIADAQSRVLAWRVYADPVTSGDYTDISARNMFPAYVPIVPGQLRGLSLLASAVFDWQDFREWKRWEMIALKVFSSKTIVEENELGEVDSAKAVISNPAKFDSGGNKTAPDMQKLDGGGYTYFKAQTGSKMSAFQYGERPGRTSQEFMDQTVRDAMRGTEWDAFFSLDPQNVGGAPMRVIVDRVNRTISKRRKLIRKNVLRGDVYALAKAMKKGELPFDVDWFRWDYRGQADLTADRRYEAQTDETEYGMGWINLEDLEARRAGNWLSVREQRERETDDKCTRATRLVAKHPDMSFQEAMSELGKTGAVSFSMARRDTGDTALEDDPGGSSGPSKPADNKQASAPAPITINLPKSGRKKLTFLRDSLGRPIGAEIDES